MKHLDEHETVQKETVAESTAVIARGNQDSLWHN